MRETRLILFAAACDLENCKFPITSAFYWLIGLAAKG